MRYLNESLSNDLTKPVFLSNEKKSVAPSSKSDEGVMTAFSGFSKSLRQSNSQTIARALHLTSPPTSDNRKANKMMSTSKDSFNTEV